MIGRTIRRRLLPLFRFMGATRSAPIQEIRRLPALPLT